MWNDWKSTFCFQTCSKQYRNDFKNSSKIEKINTKLMKPDLYSILRCITRAIAIGTISLLQYSAGNYRQKFYEFGFNVFQIIPLHRLANNVVMKIILSICCDTFHDILLLRWEVITYFILFWINHQVLSKLKSRFLKHFFILNIWKR